jgi:hypothetical protein
MTERRTAGLALLLVPCAVFVVAFAFSRVLSPSSTFTAGAAPIPAGIAPSHPLALIAPALPRVHTPLPPRARPKSKHVAKTPAAPSASTATTPVATSAATSPAPATPTPAQRPRATPTPAPTPRPTPKATPAPTPTFDSSG